MGLPSLVGPPAANIADDTFAACVKADDEELLRTPLLRAALAFKWQAFGFRMWVWEIVVFLVFFLSYAGSVYILLLLQRGEGGTKGNSSEGGNGDNDSLLAGLLLPALWSQQWSNGVLACAQSAAIGCDASTYGHLLVLCTLLTNAYYVYAEVRQAMANPVGYSHSFLNWCELALLLVVFVVCNALLGGVRHELLEPIAAIGMLFMILKLTSVARGHEYMAFLVDVLSEIIVDILPLMSIVIFIVIVFAYALMLLMPDSTDEVDELAIADYNGALMTMYTWNMLMLGSFERPTRRRTSPSALMRAAIFLVVSFLVSVVVLNALIALMGDSWERVRPPTRGARARPSHRRDAADHVAQAARLVP